MNNNFKNTNSTKGGKEKNNLTSCSNVHNQRSFGRKTFRCPCVGSQSSLLSALET